MTLRSGIDRENLTRSFRETQAGVKRISHKVVTLKISKSLALSNCIRVKKQRNIQITDFGEKWLKTGISMGTPSMAVPICTPRKPIP